MAINSSLADLKSLAMWLTTCWDGELDRGSERRSPDGGRRGKWGKDLNLRPSGNQRDGPSVRQ